MNMGKILTEQQKAFVQHFSQTGNATQAAKNAGYSVKTAEQQGYELKNKLAIEIENETRKLMGSCVPMAVDKLKKLVEDERVSPSVRLGAINSILDRTGYQTTHKVEDVIGKKSDEELKTELNHLLSNIMIDNKDIN